MQCSIRTRVAFSLYVCLLLGSAQAQRASRNRSQPPAPAVTSPAAPPGLYGLPIIYDTASGPDSIHYSRRPTSGLANPASGPARPLPFPPLRYDDALYAQKIWREIDFGEKLNQPFRYEDGVNSPLFAGLLLDAAFSGEVAVFGDDRFSQPLSPVQLKTQLTGTRDTFPRMDPATNTPNAWVVTSNRFDPHSITRIRIMEEWVFDRASSRMQSRIIGIAPLLVRTRPGTRETQAPVVLFWAYFPDLRPLLSSKLVYNPKNMGSARMSWDELFSARMFSGTIVKTNLENARNLPLRSLYRDPVQALREGEKISNKLATYEQDRWSY